MPRSSRVVAHAIRSTVVAVLLALGAASCGDGSDTPPAEVLADDIPVAHTPPGVGGYGDVMPPPILARCTEPLVAGAPDLRGLWQTEALERNGAIAPPEDPLWQHVERIEQCGNRVVVTSSGVVHDMRADGTVENGVDDVSVLNWMPIKVVATFEGGVHVLRPVGIPGVEVTRERVGASIVWHYGAGTIVQMRRIDETADGSLVGETISPSGASAAS